MSYLNKHDKNLALGLGAMASWLDETIEEQEGRNKTDKIKNLTKNLKSARTFTYKALDSLMDGLDENEVNNTINRLDYMKILICYSNQAYKEQERMDKLDSIVRIDSEEFLNIVEYAIEQCRDCDLGIERQKSCDLKNIFIKYDIEPFDPEAEGCPFKLEG